jgi:hypothetical protein
LPINMNHKRLQIIHLFRSGLKNLTRSLSAFMPLHTKLEACLPESVNASTPPSSHQPRFLSSYAVLISHLLNHLVPNSVLDQLRAARPPPPPRPTTAKTTSDVTSNLPCLLACCATLLYRSFPKLILEYCVAHPKPGTYRSSVSSTNFRNLYMGERTSDRISV